MRKTALTEDERRYIEAVIARCGGRRGFRIKNCWKNAQILLTYDDEGRLRYCEGFLDGSIPHAWVTVKGKVVDLTMEALARYLRRRNILHDKQHTYFPVSVVTRKALARHIVKTGEYGPVRNFDAILLRRAIH